MPSLKKKKDGQKRQFRVGRGIHLAEIQWPSTASSLMGSGDHAFLAHISSPGFLLGAGPPSVYASSLSSVRPVCPTFNPFAPPHPGIFFCFFFFFFFELLVLTAAAGAPGLFLRLLILSGRLCQHSMAAKPW